MTEIVGAAKVHEAYAFACMRCGYGWEQGYEIEHHLDAAGHEYVVYRANGERVPSPLSSPTCMSCGGHVVRIMRSGRVSTVLDMMARTASPSRISGTVRETGPAPIAGPIGAEALAEPPATGPQPPGPQEPPSAGPPTSVDGPAGQEASAERASRPQPPWRLTDLFHPFRRR
ncbi:hypothetical protein ABT354_16065 [Streptomyces sp. NPDC000594]|uniref:hypothetical protein n=1 Tax=Streptomyces sp. NPDC000594 TaxID=3154261 RepID=UPI00331843DF